MKRSEERKELQLRATFLALLLLSLSLTSKGQQVGIGTNVSWWLTSTPNAELEIALSKKLPLNLSGSYNAWTFFPDEMTLRHYLVQPEVR